MIHYGDITKIDGHKVPLVDVVTGGSPCQDLSVAGKRAGLAGERSGLFMEQMRIIKEMRDESIRQLRLRGADFDIRLVRPRYMVWENVPGAFSSNKGEDFRCVLEETARIADEGAVIPGPENGKWTPSGCILANGWSIAWRVHDAQFWGVPQRRKRISLVADFGGQSAPEILFESKSVSGNTEQGEQTREETSGAAGEGADKTISYSIGNGQIHDAISPSEEVSKTLNCMCDPMKVLTVKEPVCVGNGQMCCITMKPIANLLDTMHDQQAVLTYGLDRASFNQGKNAQYDFSVQEEIAQPIVARGPGGGTDDTVGALCARDYKGVGSQYVNEGKCIVQSI